MASSSSLAEQINTIGTQITALTAEVNKASQRYDEAATRYRDYEAKHEGSSDLKVKEHLHKLEKEKESYQKEKEDLRRILELYLKEKGDLRRELYLHQQEELRKQQTSLMQPQQQQQQGGQIIINTSSHISLYIHLLSTPNFSLPPTDHESLLFCCVLLLWSLIAATTGQTALDQVLSYTSISYLLPFSLLKCLCWLLCDCLSLSLWLIYPYISILPIIQVSVVLCLSTYIDIAHIYHSVVQSCVSLLSWLCLMSISLSIYCCVVSLMSCYVYHSSFE